RAYPALPPRADPTTPTADAPPPPLHDALPISSDEPAQVKRTKIHAPAVDVRALAETLRLWYEAQGLEATMAPTPTGQMVQCRTRRTLKRAFGMGAALTVILRAEGEDLLVEIGPAKWLGKGAAAGAGLAGAGLAVAAAPVAVVVWAAVGIGAWRQYRLPRQTLTFLREKAPTHVRDAQRSHAAPSATRRPRKTLDKPG